jgi:alpha-D-ribose 1-methylphosphonate 5-triphosphate synthase subunit PhnH
MTTALDAGLAAQARLDGTRSQGAFRSLLDAVARPGTLVPLPEATLPATVPPALVLPLALADVGVGIEVVGPDAGRWLDLVTAATGARHRPLEAAEIVVDLGDDPRATITSVRRGRTEAPEEAARLALGCRRITAGHTPGCDVLVELQGPGIPGARRVALDGVPTAALRALRDVNRSFPVGVDTWLVADDHQVVGLPRSTRITLLDGHGKAVS